MRVAASTTASAAAAFFLFHAGAAAFAPSSPTAFRPGERSAAEFLPPPRSSWTPTTHPRSFFRRRAKSVHPKAAAAAPPPSSSSSDSSFSDECSLEDETAALCLADSGAYECKSESFLTVREVYVAEIDSLKDRFPSDRGEAGDAADGDDEEDVGGTKNDKAKTNVIKSGKRRRGHKVHSDVGEGTGSSHVDMEYNRLVSDDELVLVDLVRRPGMGSVSRAFHLAGPRETLHFDPSSVNAAIVTCGGLCPGLNNVIRELVHSLTYLYGAKTVYGITGGFHGFHSDEYTPVVLTNELVENIHHEGGTVLRSARGGFDVDKILAFLRERDVSQLYVIGGDGTHRGAYAISRACVDAGLNVAVAGIPKTIDNDVDYIDRSFGFSTAVEAAQAGIRTAKTEAMCNVPNGIGIIKLMGRSAGFLAAFAALGSGDVDLVLVPEVPIVLDGPDGILPYLRRRVKEHKFAVVVVAEGAGEELLGVSEEVDAGGNRARPKIGQFVREKIEEYFEGFGETATIKYIDPSYTVRSVPANGADSLYCMQLAQNAVHGAMAGMTGFSVGLVNNCIVYLPIPQLVATSPRTMDPHGMTWERIVAMTGQPNTASPKEDDDDKEGSAEKEGDVDELVLPEPSLQ